MVAIVRFTDPLLLRADNAPAGENWYDNRTVWHGVDALTLGSGGLTNTQWYRDQGPIGMDIALLEPRCFCTRGGLSFSFTGRILVIRLNVAWSWFTAAQLRIDGQLPSTMGLLTAVNTLSCDSFTYGLFQDAYVDVLVADGLTDGPHTATILIDNPDATKFFSIAGFKVGSLSAGPLLSHGTWLVPAASNITPNHITLTIENRQAIPIKNVRLSFPPGLMKADGSPIAPVDIASMDPESSQAVSVAPVYSGNEHSGPQSFSLELLGSYPDPGGNIIIGTDFDLPAGSPSITYLPVPWYQDSAGPGGVPRAYCDAQTSSGQPWLLTFDFDDDALDVTVSRSAGWGVMGLYDGPTIGAALLHTLDCSNDDGGAAHTYHLTGFGPGAHTAYLRKRDADALFVVFLKAEWSTVKPYSMVVENFQLQLTARQPVPMLPGAITVTNGYDVDLPSVDQGAHDYSGDPVRDNLHVTTSESLYRFPTFCVFYGSGNRELLAEYDVLILDPIGARTADVIYWQSLGIKCFGYISSGEEVGFYENRYDFASPLAPRKDPSDPGPGGYSKNYMFTRYPAAGPPDKNAVWASYYMDPRPASGYRDWINDYYVPQVFGGPEVVVNEAVVTHATTITAGSRIVFDTAKAPIDAAEDIILTTNDGSHTYIRFQDYTYDIKTGAFVLSPTISPPVTAGQTLRISYTRLGHNFDGIFWDTVDTPDVYSSSAFGYVFVPGYAEAFAEMLNLVALAHPGKGIIYNRGFTILPDIIDTATGVMFETWLTAPTDIGNLATTGYAKITDPAAIAYNEDCNRLMRQLRVRRVFDVYSLNYAVEGPDGDALREYCRRMDAERGYSSWQTIILLNDPTHNDSIDIPDPRVNSNAFQRLKFSHLSPAVWDGGSSIWDGGASEWWS